MSKTTSSGRALYSGLAIFCIVMAVNALGDGLRDALDPRQQYVMTTR